MGQLGKLAVLLVAFICSSSLGDDSTTSLEAETSSVNYLSTLSINNSLLVMVKNFVPTNKANTEHLAKGQKIDLLNTTDSSAGLTTQEETPTTTAPTTFLVPTKDSKEVPVKETIGDVTTLVETTTSTAHVTITSTISKDPSPSIFSLSAVTDHIPTTNDLPNISHDNDKTKDHETSTSHPSGETQETPVKEVPRAPKSTTVTSQINDKKAKDRSVLILILVFIVILILVLVTMVVILVRNKRRRGSQSFHSQKRSSKKQDVWAGQVPELGDGQITQNPIGVENGRAGNKAEPGKEQEMVTFISGDKKEDSVVEINELGKGDTLEEKQPLLEDSSQVTGEAEKPPVEEQIPAPTMEQIQV